MDNLRLVLWVLTIGLIWATIQAWQLERPRLQPPPAVASDTPASAAIPPPPVIAQPTDQVGAPAAATAAATTSEAASEVIHVRTDVLDVEIDSRGGDLRRAWLSRVIFTICCCLRGRHATLNIPTATAG